MKIGVNAQPLVGCQFNGIRTYLNNLLIALSRIDKKNEYLLFSATKIATQDLGSHFSSITGKKYGSFSYLGYSKLIKDFVCDVGFIPKETVPLKMSKPVIITAYDLFFLKHYSEFKQHISFKARLHYQLAARYAFKKADKILCISEDCKKDLIEICGIDSHKIVNTYLGYDSSVFFLRPIEEMVAVRNKYGITEEYFVNISSVFWARKNVMGVLKAFLELCKKGYNQQLLMIGQKGSGYPEMQTFIKNNQLQNKVRCLFAISHHEIAALLNGATGLVFPSFHEGFGLPIIEAMAAHCPVITSCSSAMQEVTQDAGLLVDPYSSRSIAEAMIQLIENSGLREDLRKRGIEHVKKFSWEHTAQKTLQVLQAFA